MKIEDLTPRFRIGAALLPGLSKLQVACRLLGPDTNYSNYCLLGPGTNYSLAPIIQLLKAWSL